jgi:hypothetical protein
MKILGLNITPIHNKIESPQTEKIGKFTYTRQASPRRTVDIGEFVKALQVAESTRNPLRYRLYDMYQESIDYVPHLRALLELRYLNILNKNIRYTINDKADEQMEVWLQSPAFKQFVKDILDTRFWGFSLFDFTDAKKDWFGYDLVSRKHVDPIRAVVYRDQTGSGPMPYNTAERKKYVMAVGEVTDLGLLKNATPIAIHIRNMTGDMMNYVELAGNNFTVYKDSSNDPRIANQINEAEKNKSTSGYLKLPGQVEREIENQSSTQQNQLFTGIHDLLNKELSKLLLGSTMGIEDGGSLSQAEVHERTMGKVFQSDIQYVLDVLNYDFADKLELWGKPTNGRFEFDNDNNDSESKEITKDLQLQSLGLNFTPEYLAEKYGIPTEAIKQTTPTNDPLEDK